VVVALDERSLAAVELAGLPRALMSPVLASVARRALDAGAAAVGFDIVPAFDARDLRAGDARPLERWDDALLSPLVREGRAGRVVVATTRRIAPARRFVAATGAAGLGEADLDIDPDGVARRVALTRATEGGEAVPTLAGALVRAAGGAAVGAVSPSSPRAVNAGRVVALVDVLRCDEPAALAALFGGRVALVRGVLAGEDRRAGPDRFAPKPEAAPPGPPCVFARPATRDDEPRAAAGVFLRAAAVEAALSGAPPRRSASGLPPSPGPRRPSTPGSSFPPRGRCSARRSGSWRHGGSPPPFWIAARAGCARASGATCRRRWPPG
jgi:hypothetical protein